MLRKNREIFQLGFMQIEKKIPKCDFIKSKILLKSKFGNEI